MLGEKFIKAIVQRAGIADGGGLEFRPPGTTAD